ncbi:hypothetical protein PIB30_051392 [Stylosanthes scabra]|uniref:Uncharacterized protein n=1 Tax=Stylosanthes scabra TaxID=79078 RepID=A0ABU6UGK7_9FABA|nr:hypothetical protein [Stylosanthes scabra]
MPIYHDYHGDFHNSINSSWNQIQASLKILLPTYQPIPSDNLDQLSFLSYQKQKRICADFKQTYQESENQKSEYESQEEATIQNAIKITVSSTLHQPDPDIPSEINEGKFGVQYSDSTISDSIKQDLNSDKNRSQFQSQYDKDEDELNKRRLYRGSEDRIAAVVLQRPPPEPPDPKSLAVGEGEPVSSAVAAETRSCRSADLMAAVTGIHSGAEDGAVTKGKVEEHAYLVLAREVTRPPPKPPNPDSHTMAFGEASTSTSTNRNERSTANNGAEGGAFAEGKRKAATKEGRVMRLETVSRKTAFMTQVGDDDMAADLTGGGHADVVDNGIGGSSVEVGVSLREKWTLSSEAGSTTSVTAKGGVALRNGEARFCRVSPIVANTPLLLAAVLPWNRVKGKRHTTGGLLGGTVQWRSLSLSQVSEPVRGKRRGSYRRRKQRLEYSLKPTATSQQRIHGRGKQQQVECGGKRGHHYHCCPN